jgi:hypothetical protein
MSLAPRAKPSNRAQKTGVLMARAPNVKGFAQDLLKGSPRSLTWWSACEDEPVYRIARRKKICVGRFGRLASIAGIFWPGC